MPKPNLHLKLHAMTASVQNSSPNTPLDQTIGTPVEQPNNGFHPKADSHHYSNNHPNVPTYFSLGENSVPGSYNSNIDENDDILTDIDEPGFFSGPKLTKTYTVHFNPRFDDLLVRIYHELQSVPTNTPFPGIVPPSGLLGKIATETINRMINLMSDESNHKEHNLEMFDFQGIITREYLVSPEWQPIFSRLVRRRLLDLCSAYNPNSTGEYVSKFNNRKDSDMIVPTLRGLPESTSIDVVSNANGTIVATRMPNSKHQSSISNLSLNELNVNNYKASGILPSTSQELMNSRSRSSSLSLRKQSLTRNNSTASTSWLHVGNIHGVRPKSDSVGSQSLFNPHAQFTSSTDSLPEYASLPCINRSANGAQSQGTDGIAKPPRQASYPCMPSLTPPSTGPHQDTEGRFADFHFYNPQQFDLLHYLQSDMPEFHQPNQSGRGMQTPSSSIMSDLSNIVSSTLSIDTSRAGPKTTLDSPFMSAHPLASDLNYYANGFPQMTCLNKNTGSTGGDTPDPVSPGGPIRLGKVGPTDKKRDSFNAKRGIL